MRSNDSGARTAVAVGCDADDDEADDGVDEETGWEEVEMAETGAEEEIKEDDEDEGAVETGAAEDACAGWAGVDDEMDGDADVGIDADFVSAPSWGFTATTL